MPTKRTRRSWTSPRAASGFRAFVGVEQRAEGLRLGQDVGQERLARQAHSPTSRESSSSAPAVAIGSHSGRNDSA